MADNLEMKLIQVTPQRSVLGANFNKGIIDLNWSIGGNLAWIPSKSYFRVGMKVTTLAAGAQPAVGDQLAFADSVCGNLFNNVYFRAGGQDVSSIINYSPQATAIRNRLGKSGAWLENTGKVSYGLDADFSARVNAVSTGKTDNNSDTTTLSTLAADTFFETATVSVTVAGAVVGVNTDLNVGLPVGSQIIDTVTGDVYTVLTAATAAVGTNMLVSPLPAKTITATAKRFYKLNESQTYGGRNEVYTMWQPPIGIFDETTPMGSGDYRIQLNPNSQFRSSAVETSRSGTVAGVTYDFEITELTFYVATIRATVPRTGIETLHLMETLVQSKPVVTGENVLDFTVPVSTTALSVFIQATTAGSDALTPPSNFTASGGELLLNSIQLTYANQIKPSTRWSSAFSATANQLTQRYNDTMMETGMIENPGGSETYEDWLKNPIFHYSYERDADDRSTQVQLQANYGTLPVGANIFLVSHYRRTAEISIENGFVTSVNTLST